MALCKGEAGESLVVCVSSANLTRGGWWTNLEVADVVRLTDGERHGFIAGLTTLVRQLERAALPLAEHRATRLIGRFLERQAGYTTASYGGVVRPTLLPGWTNVVTELRRLFGHRLDDMHLEVISPFHDADPLADGAALDGLLEQFQPRSATIALPMLGADTPVAQTVYERIAADDRVAWGRIPATYTRLADGLDAGDRSVHAKVYRFWRGGSDPFEVIVAGSHNLSSAAHSGTANFEVSVVHELRGGRQQAFLERDLEPPVAFDVLDPEEESDPSTAPLPLSIAYDWATEQAQARWDSTTVPVPVSVSRAGETFLRVELPSGNTALTLDAADAVVLRQLLTTSCVVTATTDDGRAGPLLVIELNHELKPALLEGMTLTPAELLALWSIPELRDRLERTGRLQGKRTVSEPDLDAVQPAPVSMFDQFAGVFHAFGCLRTRVDDAVARGRLRSAAILLQGRGIDGLVTVLELVRDHAEDDPALAYVTFRCARQLVDQAEAAHPGLVTELPLQRPELVRLLEHQDELRRRLVDAARDDGDPDLGDFLTWFDRHFDGPLDATTTEVTA